MGAINLDTADSVGPDAEDAKKDAAVTIESLDVAAIQAYWQQMNHPPWPLDAVRPVVRSLFVTWFRTWFDLHASAEQDLPKPPFILCSNHTSHADNFGLLVGSGIDIETFVFAGAKDYFFDGSKMRSFLSNILLNIIPFDRKGKRTARSWNRAFLHLAKDSHKVIVIYPEGTRSPDGTLQRFGSGVYHFAADLDVPVVPVAIHGAERLLPKDHYIPRPGPIWVRFGTPIPPLSETKKSKELYMNELREIIAKLKDDLVVEERGPK